MFSFVYVLHHCLKFFEKVFQFRKVFPDMIGNIAGYCSVCRKLRKFDVDFYKPQLILKSFCYIPSEASITRCSFTKHIVEKNTKA